MLYLLFLGSQPAGIGGLGGGGKGGTRHFFSICTHYGVLMFFIVLLFLKGTPSTPGSNGVPFSGSGSGGGANGQASGSGGSGVIVVRYAKAAVL